MTTETTNKVDEQMLALMTEEERKEYLAGLDDPDMQEAIEEANSMTDDEMKAALAGKDEAGNAEGEAGNSSENSATSTEPQQTDSQAATASQPEQDDETFRPVLRADLPANLTQIKTELQQQQDLIEKQFREGDLDFDEYKKADRALAGKLEQIRVAELKAHIYADQEQQRAVQEWLFQVKQFKRRPRGWCGLRRRPEAGQGSGHDGQDAGRRRRQRRPRCRLVSVRSP